jgi:hypothetical protein
MKVKKILPHGHSGARKFLWTSGAATEKWNRANFVYEKRRVSLDTPAALRAGVWRICSPRKRLWQCWGSDFALNGCMS